MIGFLVDASVMVGMIALPFFLLNHVPGGNAAMCGTIMALQAAVYTLTCIFGSGIVSKAKHGLNWAILGVGLFIAGFAVMPLYANAYYCGAVSVVAFLGLALTWPALHSWVGAEPEPNSRKRHMVWFNLSWSSGFALSPLFAGPLYDYDYRVPFAMLFGLGGLSLLLLLTMPREKDHFGTASAELLESRADHDRSSEMYLYCAWCATIVANALVAVPRAVYPERIQWLVEHGELRLLFEDVPAAFLTTDPATKFSWPASAMAMATAVSFLVLAGTNRWRHRFDWLVIMQVLSAAAFFVLGQTRSLVLITLCFIVVGANHGLAFFSSAYYSLSDPAHKHRRSSINEGAVGFGGFVGSLAFGYLVGRFGYTLPFSLTPLFVAVMVVVELMLLRYGMRRMRASKPPAHNPHVSGSNVS